MDNAADRLIAKLEAAGLTEDEKAVLSVALHRPAPEEAEVQGFVASEDELIGFNIGMPPLSKLGNFEIQDLHSTFEQAEKWSQATRSGR